MLQISVRIDEDGTIDFQTKSDGRYEDMKKEQKDALKDAITALCCMALGSGKYYFKGDINED